MKLMKRDYHFVSTIDRHDVISGKVVAVVAKSMEVAQGHAGRRPGSIAVVQGHAGRRPGSIAVVQGHAGRRPGSIAVVQTEVAAGG